MSVAVIKLGGSSLEKDEILEKLALMIRKIHNSGNRVVVVHGGGPAINHELNRQGISWTFIEGQRQTTPEMMKVINDVLDIKINNLVIKILKENFIQAIKLSGANDFILNCRQTSLELQRVGTVNEVFVEPINKLLTNVHMSVPVISPIGFEPNGDKFNVNADWAAAKIAVSLKAKDLIFLTDQNGILGIDGKVVTTISKDSIHQMINSGIIYGGMLTKVKAMMMAFDEAKINVSILNAYHADRYDLNEMGTTLVDNYSSK